MDYYFCIVLDFSMSVKDLNTSDTTIICQYFTDKQSCYNQIIICNPPPAAVSYFELMR